jgi:phosphoglycolate phosphatase
MHGNCARAWTPSKLAIHSENLSAFHSYFLQLYSMFLNSIPLHHRQFDAALIDLDGTLVDTVGDFVLALQGMLTELPAPFCGFEVQEALVTKLVGKGSENLIKSLLSHINSAPSAMENGASGISPPALDALFEPAMASYQRSYAAINGRQSSVYAGALEGLQQMKAAGWRLACVTNQPTALALELLERKGLAEYFEFTLGGDALPRKKPDPLPLLHACQRLGCTPQRTLMVGDSSNDAQAARAAGMPVVLVRYGYNHGEPVESAQADAYTDALDVFMNGLRF